MIAPTQLVLRHTLRQVVVTLFCLVALFGGSAAHASSSRCATLFEPDTAEFQTSERYRRYLLNHAKHFANQIRLAGLTSTANFQVEIEKRDSLTVGHINRSLLGSKTLAGAGVPVAGKNATILPPGILPETMEFIRDVGVPDAAFIQRLQHDPYFAWLKNNSLRYQASQRDHLKFVDKSLKPPADQADPIQLLLMYRKEGMDPELALIRLMRNLDPVLSPTAFASASSALYHMAIERELRTQVIPRLAIRETDAWIQMQSLREGKKNLLDMLSEQVSKFGKIFPRAAYERILIYKNNNDPAFAFLNHYRARRDQTQNEEMILFEFDTRLDKLRDHLGLSREFPINRLYDVVEKTSSVSDARSYEEVLSAVFDPGASTRIRELRLITELGDALSSRDRLNAYLRSLLR